MQANTTDSIAGAPAALTITERRAGDEIRSGRVHTVLLAERKFDEGIDATPPFLSSMLVRSVKVWYLEEEISVEARY